MNLPSCGRSLATRLQTTRSSVAQPRRGVSLPSELRQVNSVSQEEGCPPEGPSVSDPASYTAHLFFSTIPLSCSKRLHGRNTKKKKK